MATVPSVSNSTASHTATAAIVPTAVGATVTSAIATVAVGGVGGAKVLQPTPPSGGSRKTKNSSNRERGSVGKALNRACDMFRNDGDDGKIAMLSMQMQQIQQQSQQSQQNQFLLHQQLQMQLSVMEKRAEMTEKYLKRLVKNTGRNAKKKAKTGSGESSSSSSDEDK